MFFFFSFFSKFQSINLKYHFLITLLGVIKIKINNLTEFKGDKL